MRGQLEKESALENVPDSLTVMFVRKVIFSRSQISGVVILTLEVAGL